MTLDWQVVFDAHDPHTTADFWAGALGYQVETYPDFIASLLSQGAIEESDTIMHNAVVCFADLVGICHPDDVPHRQTGTGAARRILFQRVPEAKLLKNRLHLDINAGPERRESEVARLVDLGATILAEMEASGSRFTTMRDPEGNEFDVQ